MLTRIQTYNVKCEELARAFLDDAAAALKAHNEQVPEPTEDHVDELACAIQGALEDWLEDNGFGTLTDVSYGLATKLVDTGGREKPLLILRATATIN